MGLQFESFKLAAAVVHWVRAFAPQADGLGVRVPVETDISRKNRYML